MRIRLIGSDTPYAVIPDCRIVVVIEISGRYKVSNDCLRCVSYTQNDMTTVLILLEEVIRNYQINLLLISLMISLICPKNCKRKRWNRLNQSLVLDSIPAHVRQLDRLVRVTDRACVDNLRMDRNTFGRLCRILRDRVGLIDQRLVSVEEQVAMFLCVLAHHKKSRIVEHNFMWSSQTVSKYIHIVLRGILTLHSIFLVNPTPIDEDCPERRVVVKVYICGINISTTCQHHFQSKLAIVTSQISIYTMSLKIPPQAMFFYRGKWTQEMDAMLLSTLITLRTGREWEDGNVPAEVLRNVRDVINHPFGLDLTTDDISVRVKLLKARFVRFKKLVKTNGVQWNTQDRIVAAMDETWKFIFKRDASAAEYYYRDEPDFSLLASFFGPYDVKVEIPDEVITISDNSAEVIVLSDSDVPEAPMQNRLIDSPAISDEATSPMPVSSTFVRRKLFEADKPSFHARPSTSLPIVYNTEKMVNLSPPDGESCASWSPSPK
ncbi:hypothetical protein SASPL_157821 [Salvia splendens]|uniref:Myb/SANT-like domain-containing protein n=1 Tax=Salvia splendens TaxID=180675 RepID=A0A8X8VUA9_SALSN|nr:hypothetical protein SASPL_157821 [Salvia splendens]